MNVGSSPALASAGPGPGLTLRPAQENEARACRMLLPEMFAAHGAPDLLVAIVEKAGRPRLAGAAAVGTVHARKPELPFLVHVVPALRRQGVGRALVQAVMRRVRGRTEILRALHPVPADSQAAQFLACCGLDQYDTIRHFEVDGLTFLADMARLRRGLERSGRVPSGARLLRLRDAPADPVAALVARNFGTPPAMFRARLDPSSPAAYDLDNSVVLTVDGVVAGALVYLWQDGVPMIEVRVVDARLRGGWANVLMLEAATRNGWDAGGRRFRFFADERLNDTMRLARRAGAEEIKVERHYWSRLG